MHSRILCLLVVLATVEGGHGQTFDADHLLRDVEVLAADSLEGRRTGTRGNEKARRYLVQRFGEVGLQPGEQGFEHQFSFLNPRDSLYYENAANLIGFIEGTGDANRRIVVSAHYDHLGIVDGEIYNGADDNASGIAGLLAAASYFRENPPLNTLVFVAFDAEEMGLRGARAFVQDPPINLEVVEMNVNLDMISRSDHNELYASGTYHHPRLRPHIEQVAQRSAVAIRFGHDSPDLPPGQDWTMLSDHGAFHEVGIPFIYFGVEDHDDYHQPTDVFENIHPRFFINAVAAIIEALKEFDQNLPDIRQKRDAATFEQQSN